MNIKIGEKIRQLRQRDGRKQEDLAGVLGVSPRFPAGKQTADIPIWS